jgi:hypothetical protein
MRTTEGCSCVGASKAEPARRHVPSRNQVRPRAAGLAGRKCTSDCATQGPPLIDKTTEALNAIVAALHAAAAKADDVQLDAVQDADADHVVQVMAVSLRKLNRLLGQLVEGHAQPSEQPG